jgi:DNA polymerase (family X)
MAGGTLTNAEIARALLQLADAWDAAEGRQLGYRARALRVGARAIDALDRPAIDLHAQGTLTKVKGVGQGIARRVEELARTGALKELQELGPRTPALGALLAVRGIGPKTARLLHAELGVTSLDDLEAAVRAGGLDGLPGLGARKSEQILRAIDRARSAKGRVRLERAERETGWVVDRLRRVPGVVEAARAGSFRRRADTVGDVNVLVATTDPAAAVEAILTAGSVSGVLTRDEGRAAVTLHSGLRLDLRTVPPPLWGAALVTFTGSRAHVEALRARGVLLDDTTPFADEEAVYRAAGLPWIPPELREGKGEIEAALRGALPRLLELADLRGDLHMHTDETDGRATLKEMVEAARALGREYIAITDHSQNLKMVRGLDADRLREQGRQIRELEEELGGSIRVLRGIEADILQDGSIDLGPEVLAELDWVIGSVHSHFQMPRKEQTERIIKAMESGQIDVVGHPTGRILEHRPPYDLDMEALVATGARTGVALELDAYPDRLDLSDVHCRMAAEAGAWLTLDSDSHAVSHLRHLGAGVDVARRGWVEPRHVLNTRPLGEFLEIRDSRRRPRV